MIEDPPILTLKRNISRPTETQINFFKGVQTGFIVDAMNGRGALDGRIKPLSEDQAIFSGMAITCHTGPADNLAVFGAMKLAEAGDVIVASTDEFHQTAVVGDLVLGMMKNKKIKAFVTDGFVRDIQGIRQVGLPCFSMGVTPNSPARNGPGSAGSPISIGNVSVSAGDIIVGDIDGVVVVPNDIIQETIKTIKEVISLEEELDAKIKSGLEQPEFITEIFKSDLVKEIT